MVFEIDLHSGVPIYKQIMEQVHRQIMTGQLAEGEQLEQVRSLAKRLKVNPMTVSKAYSFLEQEGLVSRRRGVGIFVAKVKAATRKKIKGEMLKQAMNRAAALAVQLDVSLEEAELEFKKYFKKYQTRNGS